MVGPGEVRGSTGGPWPSGRAGATLIGPPTAGPRPATGRGERARGRGRWPAAGARPAAVWWRGPSTVSSDSTQRSTHSDSSSTSRSARSRPSAWAAVMRGRQSSSTMENSASLAPLMVADTPPVSRLSSTSSLGSWRSRSSRWTMASTRAAPNCSGVSAPTKYVVEVAVAGAVEAAQHDGQHELVPVVEVAVDRGPRHLGRGGDVLDGGLGQAEAVDAGLGRVEQAVAGRDRVGRRLVAPPKLGHRRTPYGVGHLPVRCDIGPGLLRQMTVTSYHCPCATNDTFCIIARRPSVAHRRATPNRGILAHARVLVVPGAHRPRRRQRPRRHHERRQPLRRRRSSPRSPTAPTPSSPGTTRRAPARRSTSSTRRPRTRSGTARPTSTGRSTSTPRPSPCSPTAPSPTGSAIEFDPDRHPSGQVVAPRSGSSGASSSRTGASASSCTVSRARCCARPRSSRPCRGSTPSTTPPPRSWTRPATSRSSPGTSTPS